MAVVRRVAEASYRWLTALFALAVVVEFFLAGAGVFGEKVNVTLRDQKSFDPHRAFGYVLIIAALLLLVLCLLWWAERIWLLATFLLFVLTIVQSVLAHAGEHHRWVGALHPVNAIAVLGLAAFLAHRAWWRDLKVTRGRDPRAVAADGAQPRYRR